MIAFKGVQSIKTKQTLPPSGYITSVEWYNMYSLLIIVLESMLHTSRFGCLKCSYYYLTFLYIYI